MKPSSIPLSMTKINAADSIALSHIVHMADDVAANVTREHEMTADMELTWQVMWPDVTNDVAADVANDVVLMSPMTWQLTWSITL